MPKIITNSQLIQPRIFIEWLTIMNTSVLVIGSDEFLTIFVEWYGKLLTNMVVVSSTDILSILQQEKPDVLILQANYLLDLSLYSDIKKQGNLPWLFIIVIEIFDLNNQSLSLAEQLMLKIQALENGADAYLLLNFNSEVSVDLLNTQKKLLQIYIKMGKNYGQQYRELLNTNDLLSAIALSDPLTSLNNRRALEWELPRQLQNCCSQKQSLSLMILDVDYFKSVNDNHGHLVGDHVLQLLASRLQNNLRVQDTIFRYGGEEFIILLKKTDSKTALEVAQRLRKMIEEQTFKVDRNLTLSITISIGVSTLVDDDDEQGISLINRADQNLLLAKALGRNQVVGIQ